MYILEVKMLVDRKGLPGDKIVTEAKEKEQT